MNGFPSLLALDFDGVICNGLQEYFKSSERTYQSLWKSDHFTDLDPYAERFYQLRPVIETGWEMPLLIRAMVLGISDAQIFQNWGQICQDLIEQEKLDQNVLIKTLDQVRDQWIESDLEGWLALHQFYPGVINKLSQVLESSTQLSIISTKEGRFVKQLLKNQGIELSEQSIFGKEIKRSKADTLENLLTTHSLSPENLWFVEDLLKTLQAVQKRDSLQGIKLYLAAWGYNTPEVRATLTSQSSIKLLSLEQFSQPFIEWN